MSAPTLHSVDEEERVLAVRCELLELERDAEAAVATADLLEEWVETLGVESSATEWLARRFDAFLATLRTEAAGEDEALLHLARRAVGSGALQQATGPVEAAVEPAAELRFEAQAYVEPVAVTAAPALVVEPPTVVELVVEPAPVLEAPPVVEVRAIVVPPPIVEPSPVAEPVVADMPTVEVPVDVESGDEFAALAIELPEADGAEQSRWAGSGTDGAGVDVAFWNEHAPPWWSRRPRLSVSNALQASAVVAGSVAIMLRLG